MTAPNRQTLSTSATPAPVPGGSRDTGAAGGFNLSPYAARELHTLMVREDRPAMYHPGLARKLGSPEAALLVAQSVYWLTKAGNRGHFWKSLSSWCGELAMGRKAVRRALAVAVQAGVLLVRHYEGKSPHYSIAPDRLKNLVACIDPCQKGTGQYKRRKRHPNEPDPSPNGTPPMPEGHTTHAETAHHPCPNGTGQYIDYKETQSETKKKLRPAGVGLSSTGMEDPQPDHKNAAAIASLERQLASAVAINTAESLRYADHYRNRIAALRGAPA